MNACQKNVRHLQNMGQFLVQYAVPSGNLLDAARRGQRRQRKPKTSDIESAEAMPQAAEHEAPTRSDQHDAEGECPTAQAAEHEAPAKAENHIAHDECPTAQDPFAESDHDEFHMDSVSIHGEAHANLP